MAPAEPNQAATETARAAELAARASYGRLLAWLSSRARDLAAAEDALSDAFSRALETWPRDGVPHQPEAWLLTVARRRLANLGRHSLVRQAAESTLILMEEERLDRIVAFPDERLKLMLICAHPAIDPAIRTPLILQTVLGLDAARIASAFLTAPAAMGQRLVRAKAKIRLAGIPFEAPDESQLQDRIAAVLEAVYAAYGAGWDGGVGEARGLAGEALWLGRLIASLAPASAEAQGLVALMLHCEARSTARRNPQGAFVPLADHDPSHWSSAMIDEAEARLTTAFALARPGSPPGRFQLEAAIQSAHAERRFGRPTNWPAVVSLHDLLLAQAPSLGAMVSRAAALGETGEPTIALEALAALPADRMASYQPYWATLAHLSARTGDRDAALSAYDRAIGLSEDPAVRAFLLARRAGV